MSARRVALAQQGRNLPGSPWPLQWQAQHLRCLFWVGLQLRKDSLLLKGIEISGGFGHSRLGTVTGGYTRMRWGVYGACRVVFQILVAVWEPLFWCRKLSFSEPSAEASSLPGYHWVSLLTLEKWGWHSSVACVSFLSLKCQCMSILYSPSVLLFFTQLFILHILNFVFMLFLAGVFLFSLTDPSFVVSPKQNNNQVTFNFVPAFWKQCDLN